MVIRPERSSAHLGASLPVADLNKTGVLLEPEVKMLGFDDVSVIKPAH